jgi:NAD(P)-dependent dehydrogenase (short-subunit alcohol dehydrogenase family)
LGFEGKCVVVTGAASGMGAATAQILGDLGANVISLDIKEPAKAIGQFVQVDLSDETSIGAAVAGIEGPIDGLFSCAGLPQSFPPLQVLLVNYVGHRHFAESLIPKMHEGSSISSIASTAGGGWIMNLANIMEAVTTPGFGAAKTWCEAHLGEFADPYVLSKELVNAWVSFRNPALINQGIRINCVNPGPTETPMMKEFEGMFGHEMMVNFSQPIGRFSRPEEQAWPLVFLGSPRASFINGHLLNADGGFTGAVMTGQIDPTKLGPEG